MSERSKLVDMLDLGLRLGLSVASGFPDAKAAYALVQAMKAEGRDPTAAELAELGRVTDRLHDQVQQG